MPQCGNNRGSKEQMTLLSSQVCPAKGILTYFSPLYLPATRKDSWWIRLHGNHVKKTEGDGCFFLVVPIFIVSNDLSCQATDSSLLFSIFPFFLSPIIFCELSPFHVIWKVLYGQKIWKMMFHFLFCNTKTFGHKNKGRCRWPLTISPTPIYKIHQSIDPTYQVISSLFLLPPSSYFYNFIFQRPKNVKKLLLEGLQTSIISTCSHGIPSVLYRNEDSALTVTHCIV